MPGAFFASGDFQFLCLNPFVRARRQISVIDSLSSVALNAAVHPVSELRLREIGGMQYNKVQNCRRKEKPRRVCVTVEAWPRRRHHLGNDHEKPAGCQTWTGIFFWFSSQSPSKAVVSQADKV